MDVLRVLGLLRDLAHDRDIATVALDHLPHHRNDAARGSTAKAQIMDVAFSIEAKPTVRRDRPGKLKLTCRKDRPSFIGKGTEQWFDIGDGNGGLPITPCQPEQEHGISDRQAAILVALEKHDESDPGVPLSQNAVLKLAGVKKGSQFESAYTNWLLMGRSSAKQ